jgi:catechol 2,3-dioxygenase-like lactoylglutathione lyase family enzyme
VGKDAMGILDSAKPMAVVCTRDRERAVAFYRDTLGLRLMSEDRYAAVFELGAITLRLSALADWKAHSHTILGLEVGDIEAVVKALRAKGVSFNIHSGFNQDELGIWTAPDKSARVAWFNDWDGNVLSVTQF